MNTFVILYKEKTEDEFFKSFVKESENEVLALSFFREAEPTAIFGVMYNKEFEPKYKTHEKTVD